MSTLELSCFLFTLLLAIGKAFALKPCADHLPSKYTPLFMGIWILITLMVSLPWFYTVLLHDLKTAGASLLYAVAKGLLFYFYIDYSQKLTKETASSRAFMGAMAVGVIALINYSFFNELLTPYQLVSAILLSVLGFAYYFKGHVNTSFSAQKNFLILLALAVVLSVLDHLGLSSLHWYSYLLINIAVMVVLALVKNRKEPIFTPRFFFCNRVLGVAALVYVGAEIFLMQTRVTVLSVTMSNIAVLMSTPIIMLMMSWFYAESSLKKQGLFGGGAFLFGLAAFLPVA